MQKIELYRYTIRQVNRGVYQTDWSNKTLDQPIDEEDLRRFKILKKETKEVYLDFETKTVCAELEGDMA